MANGERPPYLATPKDIMQRASLLLTDVHYVITTHFEMTPQASRVIIRKFSEMFRRRLAKGQELPSAVSRLSGSSCTTAPLRKRGIAADS